MRRRRTVAAVTTAVLMLSSPPARGFTGLLSGETQLLAAILAEELNQVSSLVKMITDLKLLVAGVNDVAASARVAVRMAQAIRTFKPEQLLTSLRNGVFQEFPEIRDLANELEDLHGNVTSLGTSAFWKRYTPADYRTDKMAEKTARVAIRYSALNLMGPIVDAIDPTDTDKLLERHFRESKTTLQRAYRQSAWGQFVDRLKVHDEEARANKNLGDQLKSLEAAAAIEGAKMTEEHLDIAKTRTAREQAQREFDRHLEREAVQSMREGVMRPSLIGKK